MVHCGKSDPGGGREEPDRSKDWSVILGEGHWAKVAQLAVQPELVVVPAVVPDDWMASSESRI